MAGAQSDLGKLVKQLDETFRTLVKACDGLPADSRARVIVHQLGAHIDGFVGQKTPWPPSIHTGLAQVYQDLATVVQYLEGARLKNQEKYERIEELLVRLPSHSRTRIANAPG